MHFSLGLGGRGAGEVMLTGNERIKTSIFLTLIMILMPFAAATSITTFDDGSSEVVVQFKDGVNTVNTSEGGFSVPLGETITSANLKVSTEPLISAYNSRVGVESGQPIWDPVYNNQATSFDNISNFTIADVNGDVLPLQLSSESMITDFEMDSSDFVNASVPFSQTHSTTGEPLAWQYGYKDPRSFSYGPTSCASGDMCWGTTFSDSDYTDDSSVSNLNQDTPFSMILRSPPVFVDPALSDTYLRFSSWHELRTNYLANGDYTYSDCAYLRVRSSSNLDFSNSNFQFLPFTIPYSTGISPSEGFHLKYDSNPTADQISYDCYGIPSNNYGLAGSSTNPTNSDGWAELAANLAAYSNQYVEIEFVLENADTQQASTFSDRAGWYIDDFQIGASYTQVGEMTLNNIQPPANYDDKQPDGYGILFVDSFVPGDSSLTVDVKDSFTSQIISTPNGQLRNLAGQAIELWDIDVDAHPFISITFNFASDSLGISTPKLFGYNLGTRVGNTFSDPSFDRLLNISDGKWENDNSAGQVKSVTINSEDLGVDFSKPIYSIKYSLEDTKCILFNSTLYSKDLNSTYTVNQNFTFGNVNLSNNTIITLPLPIFSFEYTFNLNESCYIGAIWIDLYFGHHGSESYIDFGNDGVIDWGFTEPAQGDFGRQTKFWSGEVNGISQSNDTEKISLDRISGSGTGGFFLLPMNSNVETFDLEFNGGTISSVNNSYDYNVIIILGSEEFLLSLIPNNFGDFSLLDLKNNYIAKNYLNEKLTNQTTPIFKTDGFGTEWVRFGFMIEQNDSVSGGSVNLENLDIIYNFNHSFNNNNGFDVYLREYVASESQSVSSGSDLVIPVTTSATSGGAMKLSELSIESSAGYESSLEWLSNSEGLYPTGEIYEIKTTHEILPLTGSSLSSARLRFTSDFGGLSFEYDPNTGFSEVDDSANLLTLLTGSSNAVPYGSNGGKEITWRFTVNGAWDDTEKVSIFSESIATDGVVGMLGGKIIDPSVGNAVENDLVITNFEIYNAADVAQNLDMVYSNQFFKITSEIRLEDLSISPDPSSYNLVVERKVIELDGENTTVSWVETAIRSGVINGDLDWTIDLGTFASGNDTYRYRIINYTNGDSLCTNSNYQYDQDCAIQFNVSIDILEPNLLSIQLYKEYAGQGDPNDDNNWRTLYQDSWAEPRITQNFRIIANDLPIPPATAIMHVWVENDHDNNSNGIAEASEYIQIQAQSNGGIPNATYSGSYNDYANSGLRGQVSLWIECYDLAGNSIDGGGPGLDNDIITYINMNLDYPSIKNLFIEDSAEERFIANLPVNPPQGVGSWNQTMFAGNEYHLIIEAEDQNGWRDIDYVMVELAPDENAFDSKVWFFPGNNTAWTSSPFITIPSNQDGSTKAKIRNEDGNVLIDPFESEFYIDLPIILDWGMPFGEKNTPLFEIKDIDNSAINSEASFRQSWFYSDDIQLDIRGDLVNDLMISPIFYDLDEPYSRDIRTGSVYPGDSVSFTGQFVFTEGVIGNVFINPEIEMVLEITRQSVEADFEKGYSKLDGEVTTHNFTGGKFNITLNAPGSVNEFDYSFRLINLPTGAQDLTDSKCTGIVFYGCGSFTLKVDGTPPKVVQNSWTAERGEMLDTDPDRFLGSEMPTSTYHCVDVEVIIEEQGSLAEGDVKVKWKFYKDAANALTWDPYKEAFGLNEQSHVLNLTTTGQGSIIAYGDCIDLWPDNVVKPEVTSDDITGDVKLVMWIDAVDGSGSQVLFGGQPSQESGALGIISSDIKHASSYDFIFEKAQFEVRNLRLIPESPEVGDSVTVEIEVLNVGSLAGSANLSIRSVTNNGIPVLEGTVVSEEIQIDNSMWVSIKLEEFRDATTGMYYLVDDNDCTDDDCTPLYNGNSRGDTFNVKVAGDSESGGSTLLIVVILLGVIAILGIVVVVISRRDNSSSDYFDDEYDGEDDKAYAELPGQSAAPAAYISPEMVEAMQRFPQWSQEDIQGYFDQGWDINSLQEWIDSQ